MKILILFLLASCSSGGHWNLSDNTYRPGFNKFAQVICPVGYHYNQYKDFCFHDIYEKNN